MDNAPGSEQQAKAVVDGVLTKAMKVITNPVGFFREMPKTGGFGDPIIFTVAIGVVMGVIQAGISLVVMPGMAKLFGLAAIVLGPIWAVIGSFIGGAILFVIWKIMGSKEEFEASYRCAAYSAAIAPITVLAALVPLVGWALGPLWGLYLVVTASVEVHKIAAKTAWLVFGIITGVWILMAGCTVLATRHAAKGLEAFTQEMQKATREMQKESGAAEASSDALSSEAAKAAVEANKAAAAMMKAMEAQSRKARIEMEKAAKQAQAEADKAEKDNSN